MPEQHLFEYAVIRLMPRVEREEFMNVGVILFCAKKKFLEVRIHVDANRISQWCPDCDTDAVKRHLESFHNISSGKKEAGPIASLDLASRFRWLTATRSTVIQPSKVHPGLTADPTATLENLFQRLVL